MLQLLIKRIFYGLLVLAGVVVIVFFIFQAFADPARLIAGQTGDKKTMETIPQLPLVVEHGAGAAFYNA